MGRLSKPESDEYFEYYGKYVSLVGDDPAGELARNVVATRALIADLPEAKAMHRYAPGKWSVKQVVGHLSDCERVFAYRALRFARADVTELPGFDEDTWAPMGGHDDRTIASIAAEFEAVRRATLALLDGLPQDAMTRRGVASGKIMSVRAAFCVIVGHETHHVGLLRERYGLG